MRRTVSIVEAHHTAPKEPSSAHISTVTPGDPAGVAGGSPAADIRLEGVTKRFGDAVAVDDLTLDVPSGAFFALIGPSGCGKTTTLRMIGGFEHPDAGRVRIGGQEVADLPPYQRSVNTVFQSYALFPHLTVARNVAFGLDRRGVARPEVTRRVGEALELVDLEGTGDRRPRELSGGQQQRVALARALVNEPRACSTSRWARWTFVCGASCRSSSSASSGRWASPSST
jgi:spermidine/putrescine transport system ATP-binding protein